LRIKIKENIKKYKLKVNILKNIISTSISKNVRRLLKKIVYITSQTNFSATKKFKTN